MKTQSQDRGTVPGVPEELILTHEESIMVALGRAFDPLFNAERFVRRARQLQAIKAATDVLVVAGINDGMTRQ